MKELFTEKLCVGYGKTPLLKDLDFFAERGGILCVIGPNGAGKSTVLKTLTKRLSEISGAVYIENEKLSGKTPKELSKIMSVMLTDRTNPELMTVFDVAAAGRYPFTDMLGRLTDRDKDAVRARLSDLGVLSLSDRLFSELSDGQKQRVLLARALCQEPRVLVLDEPTAFLDIKYKTEILCVLRKTARENNVAVIMTLHDIDLALKAADMLLCVGLNGKTFYGTPEEIIEKGIISSLYGFEKGELDYLYGGVEMPAPEGAPRVFVLSGGGAGIPVFRRLSREGTPFYAGVFLSNDIELTAASRLASKTVCAPPFTLPGEKEYNEAAHLLLSCERVIDAGVQKGELCAVNQRLLSLAKEKNITVLKA